MDNSVKDITGQVEVIYEKTISEIDQEEGQLEAQLDRLSRKKDSLSKKRQEVDQLRNQISGLMSGIAEVEEAYDRVAQQKLELDQEIKELSAELADLKRLAKRSQTRLNHAKEEKREKYQALAEIIERFGSVKSALPEDFVSELQDTIEDDSTPKSRSRRPSPSVRTEVDEDTVLEEETSLRSTSIDDLSMPEDDFEDDDEDFFVDDDEAFLDDFDDEGLSPPVQLESTEEINLKEAVDDFEEEVPMADIGLDEDDPDQTETDETSNEDLDALFSQVELEGRETPEELAALERGDLQVEETEELDKIEDHFDEDLMGLDDDEEELTPKTARTPRKRRKLLESYLDDVPDS